ncbi:protein ALP1-like [Acyrthosiphon pisum]|uniref:DDE Tnp4 domain-containing protein n=1 Tax=Acyrthosiphon pisum TaxID=7029 RepID=A0A8R2B311_ACYPI|nr:protein ALP1-like [Acyrthosiphon pisum]|eukprot:XP_008180130.1 PREDICTED: putative nuclease HARBI1 [Acyrthosiphon pisum]
MPEPSTERWVEIANTFYDKTNFPNCLGAIDGKHIRCKGPNNSGSLYFNYKKYFSIVLMAIADANLCFIAIDFGAYGKEGDSNVFKESCFGKKLYSNQLKLPELANLPNTNEHPQPFVFIGDEAFALHSNLLRPYPGRGLNDTKRVFNYRLSRARRTVECTFGVLANKWRVLHTPIQFEPDFVDEIIKSCCVLHNFVRRRDGFNNEDTETNMLDDIEVRGTGARTQGTEVRDYFAKYFMGPGSVPFQFQKI